MTENTSTGVITPISPSAEPAIVGIGANTAQSPFLTSPTQALPGILSQGVLINQPGHVFEFGPNPLPSFASVSGAADHQRPTSIGQWRGIPTY